MDPKATSSTTPSPASIDPKLQEAYDKVMSVPTSPLPTTPPASPPTSPSPMPSTPPADTAPTMPPPGGSLTVSAPDEPADQPPMPMPNAPVIPTEPEASPTVSVASPQPANVTVTMDNSATQVQVKPTKGKGGMKISPVILVLGGIILLGAYALIWVKVFNLQVPYINP